MQEPAAISSTKVHQRLLRENIKRIHYFSALLSLFLLAFFVLLLSQYRGDNFSFLLGISIVSEVVCVVCCIFSRCLMKSPNYQIAHVIHYGFWGYFYIVALTLTHFDITTYSAVIGYTIFLTIFSFLPVLGTTEYSIAMGCQLVLLFISCVNAKMPVIQVTMLLTMNVLFFVLSRYLEMIQRQYLSVSQRLSTTLKNAEEDPLTGLLNRRGLDKRMNVILPYCIRNKSMIAVILLDIDYFKRYNDSFGHPAGDACLEVVAEVLKKTARRGTDLISRIGGEEFLVFVHGTNEMEPIYLAEKIRANIEARQLKHSPTLGTNAVVTVSVGIAYTIPDEHFNFDHLYSEADQALYYAKKNGRNMVICGGRIYGHGTSKKAE